VTTWRKRDRILALAIAGTVTLGGCATRVPERDRGVFAGNQGDSWELVLPGANVGALGAGAGPGWEVARLDGRLGMPPVAIATALDEWPTEPPPSLDRTRRLYLRDSARAIIYFDRTGPRSTGYRGRSYP